MLGAANMLARHFEVALGDGDRLREVFFDELG